MLIGVIGAAVVVVAALAVLTPTVIVNDDSPQVGLVAAVAQPEISPPGLMPTPPGDRQSLPGKRQHGPFGDLRACLGKHGLGRRDRSTPPNLRTMRDALKACRGALPGPGFGR
jgi:hypothetical protein